MPLMWDEILEQPEALENCLQYNRPIINQTVAAIKSCPVVSVIIAARGTSDHAAVYAKYMIEILTGIPVVLAAPSVFTLYHHALNMENSLVIGISQSGEAEDVLEVIKAANKQGAPTIGITNNPESPIAEEANFHLYCASGPEKSVAATKTFTAQIYLIAQLIAHLTHDEVLIRDLGQVPSLVRETLKISDTIKQKVERYRFMNECFVLARGINYAIALESALKIQETTYVRAKAYATSDFHHGPFAMIERNMPVIVFAPEGPSLKDVIEMIGKIKNAGAELIIVSNNDEALNKGDCSIEIPGISNDFITPFLNVTVSQMFACSLAISKGLNPDAPRGLNKVTITR